MTDIEDLENIKKSKEMENGVRYNTEINKVLQEDNYLYSFMHFLTKKFNAT